MLKLKFRLPAFIAAFLWPNLMERARAHRKAGLSWRTKGGIVAVDVVAEDAG